MYLDGISTWGRVGQPIGAYQQPQQQSPFQIGYENQSATPFPSNGMGQASGSYGQPMFDQSVYRTPGQYMGYGMPQHMASEQPNRWGALSALTRRTSLY